MAEGYAAEKALYTLYHYTTTEAMINIITNGELWMSDYRFVNDVEEYEFARRLLRNVIDRCIKIEEWTAQLENRGFGPEAIFSFRAKFEKFRAGAMGMDFERQPGHIHTLFSLSEDGDSLAQWRAYGEVCIGFRRSELQKMGAGWNLDKVRYYSPDYRDEGLRRELVRRLDAEVAEIISGRREPQNAAIYLHPIPSFKPTFVKHISFETEKEWRLVRTQPGGWWPSKDDKSYFFRSRRGFPVPSIKLGFKPLEAIQSVTFGPGTDERLITNLKSFLKPILPNLPQIELRHSSIPYRA